MMQRIINTLLSVLVCHVHVSLTPAFVAIHCLTNGRYPNLQAIYSGVLKVKKAHQ